MRVGSGTDHALAVGPAHRVGEAVDRANGRLVDSVEVGSVDRPKHVASLLSLEVCYFSCQSKRLVFNNADTLGPRQTLSNLSVFHATIAWLKFISTGIFAKQGN